MGGACTWTMLSYSTSWGQSLRRLSCLGLSCASAAAASSSLSASGAWHSEAAAAALSVADTSAGAVLLSMRGVLFLLISSHVSKPAQDNMQAIGPHQCCDSAGS
jgi:hypothetical protein